MLCEASVLFCGYRLYEIFTYPKSNDWEKERRRANGKYPTAARNLSVGFPEAVTLILSLQEGLVQMIQSGRQVNGRRFLSEINTDKKYIK